MRTPLPGFTKDLKLINLKFSAKWLPKVQHWAIMEGNRISHHVQNDDKSYRPLDQRILRKLKIDTFFTMSSKALTEYLKDNPEYLAIYMDRGITGLKDYLAGY